MTGMTGLFKFACCVSVAPMALTAQLAVAQTAPSGNTTSTVEEIVVTAQKRSENLQQVPAQVSVIGAEALEELHATQLADFGAYVPGLQVNSVGSPGQTTLSLRGIAPIGPAATVGTYIDDTPIGSTSIEASGSEFSLNLLPYDLQRIEVLQGPQGTLYGANSIGGLVKYVLTTPNLTDYEERVGFDVFGVSNAGDAGSGGRAMITGPLVQDTLGFLASYGIEHTPGFIDNAATGQHGGNSDLQQSGRFSLLWQPSSALSVKLSALFQNIDSDGNGTVALNPTTLKPIYGALSDEYFLNQPFKSTLRHYSADLSWDFDWATLVSATSYSTYTQLYTRDDTLKYGILYPLFGIPAGIAPIDQDASTKKITQEVRLSSPATDTLEWLVGAFYTHEDTVNDQYIYAETNAGRPIAGFNPLLAAQLPDTYEEYSLFGDLTYHITDQFDVAGGLRYARNNQGFDIAAKGFLVGSHDLTGSSSEGVVTYSFGPSYKITKDIMTYFRVSSGYQAGGPNIPYPGVPPTVKSDTLTNYEVGLKSEFWNQRAQFDVALFDIDWKNIQVEAFQQGTGFTYLVNGGSARSEGAEVNGLIKPFTGLTLAGNATYTDAILTQNVPEIDGLSGDRLPFIPLWSGSANADYQWSLTDEVDAHIGAGYRLVGSRDVRVTHNPLAYELGAYNALDLNADLTYKQYRVRLFVKNAGDTRAYNNEIPIQNALTTATTQVEATIIQPRTIGISFDAMF